MCTHVRMFVYMCVRMSESPSSRDTTTVPNWGVSLPELKLIVKRTLVPFDQQRGVRGFDHKWMFRVQ